MRIFYICYLDETTASTGAQRMRALAKLGHEMIPFDVAPHYNLGTRVRRALTYRLAWGPTLRSLNKAILEHAKSVSCDCIWIDKGIWIYPETVARLKSKLSAPAVHFTPDPALVFHRTRHFVRAIREYDVCITTKTFELDLYRECGAARIVYAEKGFDPDIFLPVAVTESQLAAYGSDVAFIGHSEDHYVACALAAAEVTPRLSIWGKWERYVGKRAELRPYWKGPGIWNHDYAAALACSKIGLGLLSKWIPEQITCRTFEIPACGTMLLAERTEAHEASFREGIEAEFFGSLDELKSKLRFYLRDDAARRRIALAGRKRCVDAGYDNPSRLSLLMREVERHLVELRKGIVARANLESEADARTV